MKKELYYYYGLDNIKVHYKDKKYLITKDNEKYLFKPCYRKYEELEEIYQVLEYNSNYYFHKIILNKSRSIITVINNTPYILLKLQIEDDRFIDFSDIIDFNRRTINTNNMNLRYLFRNNWVALWSRKIDYFEYQMIHLKDKYKIIASSINFFIGLSENGISYINQVLEVKDFKSPNISIQHQRLHYETNITDFYDPSNIVIDYKARDVCEYLKSLFLVGEYDYNYLESFLRNLNFKKSDYEMLFGRLLFPTFYFDIYEQVINHQLEEKEILKIVCSSEKYVTFLKNVYKIINNIYPIKKVDWI